MVVVMKVNGVWWWRPPRGQDGDRGGGDDGDGGGGEGGDGGAG